MSLHLFTQCNITAELDTLLQIKLDFLKTENLQLWYVRVSCKLLNTFHISGIQHNISKGWKKRVQHTRTQTHIHLPVIITVLPCSCALLLHLFPETNFRIKIKTPASSPAIRTSSDMATVRFPLFRFTHWGKLKHTVSTKPAWRAEAATCHLRVPAFKQSLEKQKCYFILFFTN